MKTLVRSMMLTLSCAAAGAAHADILDFNTSVDSYRASVYGPLPNLFGARSGQYDLGGVYRPEVEQNLLQAYVGGLLTAEYGSDYKFAAGTGVRAVYIAQDHDSGGALAVGGMAEFPVTALPAMSVSVYAYYAPSALTGGEVNAYLEYAPSIDYAINPDLTLYAGYRYIEYDLGSRSSLIADDSAHLGVRFGF